LILWSALDLTACLPGGGLKKFLECLRGQVDVLEDRAEQWPDKTWWVLASILILFHAAFEHFFQILLQFIQR